MTTQNDELIIVAQRLSLPVTAEKHLFLDQPDISEIIHQAPPYLVITQAVIGISRSSPQFIFARAAFRDDVCIGHYPQYPSLPLIDIGRAMDQSAALFATNLHDTFNGKVPLVRRLARLKGGRIEKFTPSTSHWIWVSSLRDCISATFFSSERIEPLATISGWSYEFCDPSSFPHRIAPTAATLTENGHAFTITDDLDSAAIRQRVPQAPPFLILQSAHIGYDVNGSLTIHARAHCPAALVRGHIAGECVLSPVHYLRALAQTGMVLCSYSPTTTVCIPEVISSRNIWYDTSVYFPPSCDISVVARVEQTSQRQGVSLISVSGAVQVCGREVLGTEGFTYALIPRETHPATMA